MNERSKAASRVTTVALTVLLVARVASFVVDARTPEPPSQAEQIEALRDAHELVDPGVPSNSPEVDCVLANLPDPTASASTSPLQVLDCYGTP